MVIFILWEAKNIPCRVAFPVYPTHPPPPPEVLQGELVELTGFASPKCKRYIKLEVFFFCTIFCKHVWLDSNCVMNTAK